MSKVDRNRRPKTGGRKKGTPNMATAEIKAMAQPHGPEAIEVLVKLLRAKAKPLQLAAGREILDRAYGRPHQ
jgi:hypothetical protein